MCGGRMIFMTRPVDDGVASGSRIRPQGMLAGFRALGLEVEEVTGGMVTRRSAIRRVMERIAGAVDYDYLYMENATIPLHLTEPRLGLLRRHPLLDAHFLWHCRRHGIPIGIFNNDIYWRFPETAGSTHRHLRYALYLLEFWLFARLADACTCRTTA